MAQTDLIFMDKRIKGTISKKISVPLAQGFSKAVIFLACRQIHKYTKDGCEVFFVNSCLFVYLCLGKGLAIWHGNGFI